MRVKGHRDIDGLIQMCDCYRSVEYSATLRVCSLLRLFCTMAPGASKNRVFVLFQG
uniref:Uncharacterized protein n=1 Tax=Anguilla anguilla TaxID=7936 RepID=A0A0E9Q0F2_ANGAN